VAIELASTFGAERILYDKFHDAEFARLDLDIYLPGLYRAHSELLVVFLCPEYPVKRWCQLEFRHIRQLIATLDADQIMFVSFGNPGDLTSMGILRGDGYIDITSLSASEVVAKIVARHRLNQSGPPFSPAAHLTNRSLAGRHEPIRVDISRIDRYAPSELIGREQELALLTGAWDKARRGEALRPRVITFVALGGEGKTSLVARWLVDLAAEDWPECGAAFA
jgi:hypothetical protein